MAFTDNSDLFGSINEDGINRAARHIMRQRPSWFNYGTALFLTRPELLCARIVAHPSVLQRGNPLITVEDPLPLLGSDGTLGLNFCAQLTKARIDFHPGNAVPLPPELAPLSAQRVALYAQVCGGIGCPRRDITSGDRPPISTHERPPLKGGGREAAPERPPDPERPRRPPIPLPFDRLTCFCLDLFAVCHVEVVGSPGQQRVTGRLDGLEIVDVEPNGLESTIECYLATLVQIVLLPRLSILLDTFVFDIPVEGITNATVTVSATPTSAAVPNNPAVEADELRVFIDVEVI